MPQKQKILFFINFLSIAGLPPFLGFTIKFLAITSIFNSNFFPIYVPILLLFSSFLSFYFYLRIVYSLLFTSSTLKLTQFKLRFLNQGARISLLFVLISALGSSFAPLIFSLV